MSASGGRAARDRSWSLFIDETGDTDEAGDSAVVGLLVEGGLDVDAQRRLKRSLENENKDLRWAIHAASLNTPRGFLGDRKKERKVVQKSLEAYAAALERAHLTDQQLVSWKVAGGRSSTAEVQRAATVLATATTAARDSVGAALRQLATTPGCRVALVATVCGEARLEPVEGLMADGYVLALLQTLRRAAEMAASDATRAVIELHVLERDVTVANGQRTQRLGPTHALRLATRAAREAGLQDSVTFQGAPKVVAWSSQTPAMLVLADHAANRLRYALRKGTNDPFTHFLARIREEVGVSASLENSPLHGLDHPDRGDPQAPRWAVALGGSALPAPALGRPRGGTRRHAPLSLRVVLGRTERALRLQETFTLTSFPPTGPTPKAVARGGRPPANRSAAGDPLPQPATGAASTTSAAGPPRTLPAPDGLDLVFDGASLSMPLAQLLWSSGAAPVLGAEDRVTVDVSVRYVLRAQGRERRWVLDVRGETADLYEDRSAAPLPDLGRPPVESWGAAGTMDPALQAELVQWANDADALAPVVAVALVLGNEAAAGREAAAAAREWLRAALEGVPTGGLLEEARRSPLRLGSTLGRRGRARGPCANAPRDERVTIDLAGTLLTCME